MSDEEEWYHIDDFASEDGDFVPPPRQGDGARAWEKDQIKEQMVENVHSESQGHGRNLRARK